jgi:predicted YcjX-like family ATPase
MQALEQRNPNSTSSIARGERPETIIQQLIQVNEQKQKLRNIPLSPASKAAVKDTLQAKIERLGTQLKELTSTAAAAPSEESDDSSDDE